MESVIRNIGASALSIILIVVIVVTGLTGFPMVVTAVDVGQYQASDTFEDGNADGWSASDSGVVQTSYQGTYSLNEQGSWDEIGKLNTSQDMSGVVLVKYDGSRLTGVPAIVEGNGCELSTTLNGGDLKIRYDDRNCGGSTFHDEVVTTLTMSDWNYVKWKVENGVVYLKGWTAGSGEPSGWQGSYDFQTYFEGKHKLKNDGDGYFDEVGINAGLNIDMRGKVYSGKNGSAISGATVRLLDSSGNEVTSTTTSNIGYYEFKYQDNKNYTVEVSKDGYITKKVDVEFTSETIDRDFYLRGESDKIKFDVPNYMKHGESRDYRVKYKENGTWKNVTANANVTSLNTSVVTLDTNNLVVESTTDGSINARVNVTAEYNNTSVQKSITVANMTVDNTDILPVVQKFTASLGGGTDDDRGDRGVLVIIIGTALASVVAYIATSMAGLGTLTLFVVIAWIAGFAGLELAIGSVLISTFVGLNLTQNIDYQVSR
jgi:hypothetical protein